MKALGDVEGKILREDLAGKLADLVAVKYSGRAMLTQGVFRAVPAKHRVHGGALPTQHPSGVPVDHSHQVSKLETGWNSRLLLVRLFASEPTFDLSAGG